MVFNKDSFISTGKIEALLFLLKLTKLDLSTFTGEIVLKTCARQTNTFNVGIICKQIYLRELNCFSNVNDVNEEQKWS